MVVAHYARPGGLFVVSLKRGVAAVVLAVALAGSAFGQQQGGMVVQNPLDEIRGALARTLETAGVPFADAQVRAISLAMDEQRRATEELFGQVLDFRGGPPQGAQRDQALAAIEWMTAQFLASLDAVLTPAQTEAWTRARQAGAVPLIARLGAAAGVTTQPSGGRGGGPGGGGSSQQIAQVRINNNPFTAETRAGGRGRGNQGSGAATAEVITRGGVGDYHGNANFTYQNDDLNARNAFAANKPPYTRRNIEGGFNGPVLSNRLTVGVTANQNQEAVVDTIAALMPGGIVSEGISRPALSRRLGGTGELQAAERLNLHLSTNYTLTRRDNEDVGGIRLRERARHSESSISTSTVRGISPLSSTSLLDVTVGYERNRTENLRFTPGTAIDVEDAFEGGGATDQNETTSGTASLQSLFIRTEGRLTSKAGVDLSHRRSRSLTENGFNGLFEFAGLEDFVAGRPTTYTVSIGNPLLQLNHVEAAAFAQNDVRVSRRLTLMFGLRYEAQNNLHDWNNFDPRFGYAFALNDSTVLRGGIGLFHERVTAVIVERLRRLDGIRQQEIVVTSPSYPNPFLAGTVLPSSVRVASPHLEALSNLSWQAAVERTLPGNAQVTVSYEHNLGRDEYRTLNLNAPRPGESVRPDPARGNILELQSSGRSTGKILRFTARQRLRAFTISGNYILASELEDGDAQTTFNPPSNSYDLSADWGRGDDRERQLTASVNAQLPLGIFLTLGVQELSGVPYTVTTGRDDNHDTVSNDRPPGLPRHSETGPGLRSTNINLSKVFFLRRDAGAGPRTGGAGAQVNVFANVFNAFNQTNFDRISGVLTSRRFGRPISAADPREIEIGMRFQF